MTKLILFQIDHPSKLNFVTDTSILFIRHLEKSHDVWCYTPKDIFFDGSLKATISKYIFEQNSFKCLVTKTINLEQADSIFIRHDPPYNMDYLTSCYMLKTIEHKVKIYNKPSVITSHPEKIIPVYFKDFMPKTLITASLDEAIKFKKDHKCIIKPLYGHAGEGVKIFETSNDFLDYQKIYGDYLIIQEFLPEITQGDVRIIMSFDKIMTSFIRVPLEGEIRANTARGATPHPYNLTSRQLEMCNKIGMFLKENDILLAGIDMIGNYVTEVNITSPTGVPLANKLYGKRFEEEILG
ncbi:MAG: hypothetical protein J0G32_04275 [Alphaproteobacteria bacterium]|nr:hypothetical protein [Alphaproteobacteria bacterium]OJV13843.1 MAG: hypothetical protein BGO27_08090 [Alphaproteobacteria bacterium 33-17]